jgi:integrase
MKSFLYCLKKFKGGDTVLISQINSKWVTDFQRHLENDSGLALMSAAHYSKILRATLKKAVADNVISKSPAEQVPPLNAPEADMVFLNTGELQRLADAGIEGRGAEIKRAFLVACYTGLRVVDLETLT